MGEVRDREEQGARARPARYRHQQDPGLEEADLRAVRQRYPSGYPFYLWNNDDGYYNMGDWIEAAAKAAGK